MRPAKEFEKLFLLFFLVTFYAFLLFLGEAMRDYFLWALGGALLYRLLPTPYPVLLAS